MSDLIGGTAVLRVLGELNGLSARIEEFNPTTKLYLCCVETASGLEEILSLSADKLENAKPKKAPPLSLRVEKQTSTGYFSQNSNSRVADWFVMYQSAFRLEHEWMESRGQKTSLTLSGSVAEIMLDLIFREPTAPFTRDCFFAHAADAADACGFATVDVDPNPQKVCHLRMLMVDTQAQRKGVGLALLQRIVEEYETRSLGLKFGNHAPHLDAFYAQAGFKRIGQDGLYTYMAIRR